MIYPKYHNIQSFSDQHQDLFILACTQGKRNGTYLEVGAGHPIYGNNTLLLEREFGWKGVSLELNSEHVNSFNLIRNNPCLIVDATLIDYTSLIEQLCVGSHIDFLQLDIDPPEVTFSVLKKINFNKHFFSIITFEHDAYSYTNESNKEYIRIESREILHRYGYTRVITDVVDGRFNPSFGMVMGQFEDWYIHEDYIGNDIWKKFIAENVPMHATTCSQETTNLFTELLKDIVIV